MIEHPDELSWPQRGKQKFGAKTTAWRERLLNHDPEARETALAELERCGPAGSWHKWWAFEGYTSLDCLLKTDQLLLAIEGKRTDVLSPSTDWYPHRSQLLRNLEVTQEAEGKDFVFMVIAEQQIEPVLPGTIEKSPAPYEPG